MTDGLGVRVESLRYIARRESLSWVKSGVMEDNYCQDARNKILNEVS